MDVSAVRNKYAAIGQDHVFRFFDKLSPTGREKLVGQLDALDPKLIAELAESHVRNKPPVSLPHDIRPITPYPRHPKPEQAKLYADARARGEQLLREGKVGAFLVAGGQGTRLGYDGPKGEFPVTPIKNKPLFQVFAEQILAHGRDFGRAIPWYIMTSDVNDAATRAFFTKHNHFGSIRTTSSSSSRA